MSHHRNFKRFYKGNIAHFIKGLPYTTELYKAFRTYASRYDTALKMLKSADYDAYIIDSTGIKVCHSLSKPKYKPLQR